MDNKQINVIYFQDYCYLFTNTDTDKQKIIHKTTKYIQDCQLEYKQEKYINYIKQHLQDSKIIQDEYFLKNQFLDQQTINVLKQCADNNIIKTEKINYKSSIFFAQAKQCCCEQQAKNFISDVKLSKECCAATHNIPVYNIYDISSQKHIFFVDEGNEKGASDGLTFLAEKLQINNICVVITRFKNGENIGALRFKYINEVFMEAVKMIQNIQ